MIIIMLIVKKSMLKDKFRVKCYPPPLNININEILHVLREYVRINK